MPEEQSVDPVSRELRLLRSKCRPYQETVHSPGFIEAVYRQLARMSDEHGSRVV